VAAVYVPLKAFETSGLRHPIALQVAFCHAYDVGKYVTGRRVSESPNPSSIVLLTIPASTSWRFHKKGIRNGEPD